MKWMPLIQEYFLKHNEGTDTDIKHWIRNNKWNLMKDDVIRWIEQICDKDPVLKQIWYPLEKHNLDDIAYTKLMGAKFSKHLRTLIIRGILEREQTVIGYTKWNYKRVHPFAKESKEVSK